MKLRIRSNSLRLRLGPREVDRLLRGGILEEKIRFGLGPDQLLRYRLILNADATRMSARLEPAGVVVLIPLALAERWAGGDELSLGGSQDVGDGELLELLIEKDLQCRDVSSEADQDVYPNPSEPCVMEPAARPATAGV